MSHFALKRKFSDEKVLSRLDLDLTLKRMYEPTERLALHINSWQVNANIFKVMRNAFLRDFYFSL